MKRNRRAIWIVAGVLSALGGCANAPTDSETTRETVLQYIGADVGTAGPFGKGAKKELTVLSPADRVQATTLVDRGAQAFLIFAPAPAGAGERAEPVVSRIVFVQHGRIVGDFHATATASTARPVDPTGEPVTIHQ